MSDDPNDIENPPYYRAFAIEPLDFIEANNLGYLPGTVVKYAARAGRKPGEPTLKDARKCLTFAKRWVAKLEREAAEQAAPRTEPEAPAKPETRRDEGHHDRDWDVLVGGAFRQEGESPEQSD